MRRWITLLVMLVVPLQFTWALAAGVFDHLGDTAHHAAHSHTHEPHPGHAYAVPLSGDTQPGSAEAVPGKPADCMHASAHCHPLFLSLPSVSNTLGLPRGAPAPAVHPPARVLSRVPPLPDRPPLVRA